MIKLTYQLLLSLLENAKTVILWAGKICLNFLPEADRICQTTLQDRVGVWFKKIPRTPLTWGTHRKAYRERMRRREVNEGLTWSVSALRVSVKVLSKCSGCSAKTHIKSIIHTLAISSTQAQQDTREAASHDNWCSEPNQLLGLGSISILTKTNSGLIVSSLRESQN